ncbi:MAG: L-aspartate oxidase [Cytophagales bacterium]
MLKFDYLVIGSGVAGLSYALHIAHDSPNATIAIVTKADLSDSNTKYAQGGIAVVTNKNNDSFKQHVKDTIETGCGLSNPEIVNMVISNGPKRLKELIDWGMEFDKNTIGQFDLGLEGGHSQNRILHNGDRTGSKLEETLLYQIKHKANIQVFSQHLALDLITRNVDIKIANKQLCCFGAYVYNIASKKIQSFSAKITMLATGGIGQVYLDSTNPEISTGDGIAMAYMANAEIENMEFIQFHPTAFFNKDSRPAFLISEALRGFGALLRNNSGELFMQKYHIRKELAPRDIVSRAIASEMKNSGTAFVYLDCRHLNMHDFKMHFPEISKKVLESGIDISKEMIPVAPAAHYLCGGINVNQHGQTSIKNLYACGECANTTLHGANRLASNSLLEALVFAHKSFLKSKESIKNIDFQSNIPERKAEALCEPKDMLLIIRYTKELQALMNKNVGIIRSNESLRQAEESLNKMCANTQELLKKNIISVNLIELRNMIYVSQLIVKHSLSRKINLGVFFNSDNDKVEYQNKASLLYN